MASDRSIDAALALRHWSLPEPWTVDPASGGVNNTTLFVETPAGKYVLRLYGLADPAGIRFEHGLLQLPLLERHHAVRIQKADERPNIA